MVYPEVPHRPCVCGGANISTFAGKTANRSRVCLALTYFKNANWWELVTMLSAKQRTSITFTSSVFLNPLPPLETSTSSTEIRSCWKDGGKCCLMRFSSMSNIAYTVWKSASLSVTNLRSDGQQNVTLSFRLSLMKKASLGRDVAVSTTRSQRPLRLWNWNTICPTRKLSLPIYTRALNSWIRRASWLATAN